MCVVTATTLAQLLAAYSIDAYVLVCDIEGAEAGIVLLEDAALGQCQQLIIELHDAVLGNQAYSVTELCERRESVHDFILRDRRCNVFCFERCTVRNRR